ncbi:DEAD/DEAH box helicase [uncultured Microbulbifer sp.]|uniref:DEAD/DEAH box helicase n=1 Tax=uncultured Microbulbifer sp. TaxID=348147 RepID=UPI0026162DE1|nr:DEAD/DEAH box helicase [uncultured Microbulbifer sp.]
MAEITLHPFQQDLIGELREGLRNGHKRQVLALATGGGKTVVAGELALRAAQRGKKLLFIVHLQELVRQACRHFESIGLRVGVLQGENTAYSPHDDLVVASIQTFSRREMHRRIDWIDFVVIDEAHILHEGHIELMRLWNALPFIGLSATPMRQGMGKYFSSLVRGPSVEWLTEQGFLVPALAYCPGAAALQEMLSAVPVGNTVNGRDYKVNELGLAMRQKTLVGDIVGTWQQRAEGRQTLCFAVNKAHSREIVDQFLAADIEAAHIEDRTPVEEREILIAAFRKGQIRVLSSVGVLAIGFDVPTASCLILARPTKSLSLHIQQLGRGIRRADGKDDCIVLDHAGNVVQHGLPVDFVVPDLDGGDKPANSSSRSESPAGVVCANAECSHVMSREVFVCPACGLDRPKPESGVVIVDGRLGVYGEEAAPAATGETLQELKRHYLQVMGWCRLNDHRSGYAYHLCRKRFERFAEANKLTGHQLNGLTWPWKTQPAIEPTQEVARWCAGQHKRLLIIAKKSGQK